jgi:hypothetical protein
VNCPYCKIPSMDAVASGEVEVPRPPRTAFSLALCISAAAVLVLGLAPRSVLAFAERSILSLLM